MTYEQFKNLVGKDIIIEYPFFNEIQKWNMNEFYIDSEGNIKHKRLDFIMEVFIKNARLPDMEGESE